MITSIQTDFEKMTLTVSEDGTTKVYDIVARQEEQPPECTAMCAQITSVIGFVKDRFVPGVTSAEEVGKVVTLASKAVAADLGVSNQSVVDKISRKLSCSVAEFSGELYKYLTGSSDALTDRIYSVVEKSRAKETDKIFLDSFFEKI